MTDLNIMDSIFNGPSSEMYRAEVFPELFPHADRMLVENWPAEDRAHLVGGEEAKAFYRLENTLAELRAIPQRILMGANEDRIESHG
ncbi:hypothetical protein SEA_YECEY3_54 [Mycobacterium phage Yecey3]|uniref:Uncharacterized protein n=1 Tax=Mycobacterium phage Yecey3 TaxID=2656617 RepID=A0A649V912_9CAUD|nr:hypothetical protein KIV58_gp055 [Mycobacterium phage Yecey3]QGJ88806.1 hypothetical protein SEA_YECEY3_54 [Mycobacterium phage Yecey3]